MADKSIRELERDLFASMAKVQQPLAPDSRELSVKDQPQALKEMPLEDLLALARTIDWVEADKASIRRRWPTMSEEQVEYWANF